MSSCKLFETLSKTPIQLDSKHTPTSYEMDDDFNKFYTVSCPPADCRLQFNLISGWQKYALYKILDKDCMVTYNNNDYRVLNILHLMNCSKVSDIIIFRIVKKNKNNELVIRYICSQDDRKTLCANIAELNNHLDKKCQYAGRKLNKGDFSDV